MLTAIHVYFQADGVQKLETWKASGWKNENRKPVANMDLWLQVSSKLKLAWQMGLIVEVVHTMASDPRVKGNTPRARRSFRSVLRAGSTDYMPSHSKPMSKAPLNYFTTDGAAVLRTCTPPRCLSPHSRQPPPQESEPLDYAEILFVENHQ